ncbi:MAG: hypothetical protein J1E61_06265 [Lachnospiraceae bacterium]|nr:hypothetical protein [Lachnospiraceae bacterium]
MNIGYLSSILGMYQYAINKTQNTYTTGSVDFAKRLESLQKTGTERVDAYTDYLKSKYGNVTIKSVGKDQKSLDRIGKSMSGNDVIIAPNILEEMANDVEKAAYYEKKIDDYFADIPRQSALCAARGLVYEPAGVVVHEDGSVTYISGCSDSPERVAQVNAINRAKRQKKLQQRKVQLERRQETVQMQKQLMERRLKNQSITEAVYGNMLNRQANYHFLGQSPLSSAGLAYENAMNTFFNNIYSKF